MAALRAAVFPLFAKNRRGGHFLPPPPPVRMFIKTEAVFPFNRMRYRLHRYISTSKFQGIRGNVFQIPITIAYTNSDISTSITSLRLDETRAGLGRTDTQPSGIPRDPLLPPHSSHIPTDFLLHGIVLSAVAPVTLKRFTTLNMFFFSAYIQLFYYPYISETSILPLFNHPSRLLVRVMVAQVLHWNVLYFAYSKSTCASRACPNIVPPAKKVRSWDTYIFLMGTSLWRTLYIANQNGSIMVQTLFKKYK